MTTKSTSLAIGTSISYIPIYESLPGDFVTVSQLSYKFSASILITTESTFNSTISKAILVSKSVFNSANRSLTPNKSSVTPLAPTENLLSLPAYRSVSLLLSNYTSRSYLTIDNLYIRYALLNCARVTPLKHVRSAR